MEDLGLTHPDGGIAGWTYPEQLEWLRVQASAHYRILEIGSWRGRSTVALASGTQGDVWAVDHWRGGDEETDGQLAIHGEGVYEHFLRNVAPYRVHPIRAASEDAWPMLAHLRFDMAFIDGDHSYEAVKGDILRWATLLDRNALLCGHDAEYPEVWAAVEECVANPQRFDIGRDSLIWYTRDGIQ